jgi:hypothetical protein
MEEWRCEEGSTGLMPGLTGAALHRAAFSGKQNAVELLVQRGAAVEGRIVWSSPVPTPEAVL